MDRRRTLYPTLLAKKIQLERQLSFFTFNRFQHVKLSCSSGGISIVFCANMSSYYCLIVLPVRRMCNVSLVYLFCGFF